MPAFGKLRAVELTGKTLLRFVAAQRAAKVAEATIGRRLDTLHRALTYGRDATPPKIVAIPKFPKIDESGNVRRNFATRAQAEMILERLRERDADLADAVEWAYWTGMRKGAIASLGWDSFDHETWTLRLPPPGQKKRTPRAIPLLPGHPLRAVIERRWERRKARAKETGRIGEPLIFWRVYRGAPRPGLRPGDAAPVYEYRKAWKRAAAAAGAPKLIPHDLRRTACRNAWQATKDRRLAMLLSGHATESVFERYNIDAGEQLVGALDQIATYVESQPATAPPAVPTRPRRRRRRRVASPVHAPVKHNSVRIRCSFTAPRAPKDAPRPPSEGPRRLAGDQEDATPAPPCRFSRAFPHPGRIFSQAFPHLGAEILTSFPPGVT
jgi:integrase